MRGIMSYNNNDNGENTLFAFILAIFMAFIVFYIGVNTVNADTGTQVDILSENCYKDMTPTEVLKCLESLGFVMEDLIEQTDKMVAELKIDKE